MNASNKHRTGRITIATLTVTACAVFFIGYATDTSAKPKKPVGPSVPKPSDTGLRIGGSEIAPAYFHIQEDLDLDDVTFIGPTVLVIDGDVTISGNPVLTTDAEVSIYFAGDFTMSGKASINNQGRPRNLKLYATREFDSETMTDADRQQITMNGNVDFSGVVYAPEALFTSNGGGGKGAYYGAILAYNATFNGVPGPFHYDESLAREQVPDQPFNVSGYRPIRSNDQLVNNDPNLGTYEEFIDGFFDG